MAVYPPQFSDQRNPSPMDYDLQSEKQRIAEATEEIKKELLEKWQKRYANAQIFPDKLSSMNPSLRDFLLSFRHTLFYDDLARKFNLNQQQRDNLPKIVWYVCLNKKWEQLKVSIINDLSANAVIADQIMDILDQNILSKARELSIQKFPTPDNASRFQKEISTETLLSLPVNDAIKQFPELGEQLITSEKISLKNFPESVRPSIKNWLADYTFTLGYDKHDAIARGNYLFHGNNTMHLSSTDRGKLSYLLKAFDEQTPVTVNKTLKQIVFQELNRQQRAESAPISNKITDSKLQTLPTNRQVPNNTQAQNPKPTGIPNPAYRPLSWGNAQPTKDSAPQNSSAMHDNIRFSSAQKLPYEKLHPIKSAESGHASHEFNRVKSQTYNAKPIFNKPTEPQEPARNASRSDAGGKPRELPKNVVNLKEF